MAVSVRLQYASVKWERLADHILRDRAVETLVGRCFPHLGGGSRPRRVGRRGGRRFGADPVGRELLGPAGPLSGIHDQIVLDRVQEDALKLLDLARC